MVRNTDICSEYQEKMKTTQPAFTCSKLTIQTLEQVWNMFKGNNKDIRTTRRRSGVFIVNFEHIFIVNFEHVNVNWVPDEFGSSENRLK